MRFATKCWATIRNLCNPDLSCLIQDVEDFSLIDQHFPKLQYHSLATFHKHNLYGITFYEPVFAW